MSEPRIGSTERAEYLQRRAFHAAYRLLYRQDPEVSDLASDILIALLERDKRAADNGATEPPRYTNQRVRGIGMNARRPLRRWRQRHEIGLSPARFRAVVEAAQKRGLLVDKATPEDILIARETVCAELEKIKRERRAMRAVRRTARRAMGGTK